MTVAAVNNLTEIKIPNVKLPIDHIAQDDDDRRWRVFAANYSFSDNGLPIPGDGKYR